MTDRYRQLVDELEMMIRDLTHHSGGNFVFPKIDLEEELIALRLGIYWIPACPAFPQGSYLCHDDASLQLLELAVAGSAGAWRLCDKIAIHRLATRGYLPEGARAFLTMSHTNQISLPKERKRNSTWLRAQFIYLLVNLGHLRAGLIRTRGEFSKPPHHSACDAAVEALARCGLHVSYRAAQEIVVGSKQENVAIRAEHAEWVQAVADAKRADIIANVAMPGLGGLGLSSPYWTEEWASMAEKK